MSILVNRDTRVLVQGITGKEGAFHAARCKEYGTTVVGGVTPGKGGTTHDGFPVWNTVEDAVKATGADCALIFVPPPAAADAIMRVSRAALARVPVEDRTRFLVRRNHRMLRVAALVGAVVLWELLCRAGWVPALFLPSPLGVLREGGDMLASGELLVHLAASLKRLVLGFVIGGVAGIAVGIVVGVFSVAEAVGTPLIAATFPIPKIALLPLLILWLGIGESSKVAVIALGVFFPLALNTYAGARQVDPVLVRAAVAFGAGRWSVIRKVIVPSTLPMVGIVLLSALGVLSHWGLVALERLVLPWREG